MLIIAVAVSVFIVDNLSHFFAVMLGRAIFKSPKSLGNDVEHCWGIVDNLVALDRDIFS